MARSLGFVGTAGFLKLGGCWFEGCWFLGTVGFSLELADGGGFFLRCLEFMLEGVSF